MRNRSFYCVLSTVALASLLSACDGGGTSGTAGTAGAAGTGGSSGTAGTAGTGGSSGMAGTGGAMAMCGNGTVEDMEECDDGTKNMDTGACTSMCKKATCGDSLVQAGVEDCDEGANNADTGACTSMCKSAACGDSLVQTGVEECDDGPKNGDSAACTSMCKSAVCGDGFTQAGVEECDDGAANADTAACTSMCKTAVCGDKLVQMGVEGCDDGNMVDNDECTNKCTLPACGDGIQQMGEECDLGAMNSNTGACTVLCKKPACGDGFTQMGEECDLGAMNSNTGACTAMCKNAKCGDALVQMGVEECDNGAMNSNTAACTALCKNAKCGDGLVQMGVEPCDDGNMTQADGCNNDCAVSGTPIWTQSYKGAADLIDIWNGVATDAQGNVYVTGTEGTAAQGLNIVTRKYNAMGAVQWTQSFNGVGNGNDEGQGITVDAQGNVYVTGYTQVTATNIDIFVGKYNAMTGAQIWTNVLTGAAMDQPDIGLGITVNPMNGNVYAAGQAWVNGNTAADIVVAKLDPASGGIFYFDFLNGAGNMDDFATGVTVDSTGAIIASGGVRTATNYDVWVRKYTDSGAALTPVWTRTYNGNSNLDDAGYAVTTDAMNNVLVAGMETVGGQNNNVWLRKYDAAGNTVWTQTYASPSNLNDRGYGVTADAAGNVLVCGFQAIANTTADVWVRKYKSDGTTLWTQTFNGNADQDDVANGCVMDVNGNAYVAGYQTVTGPNNDGWLRKYAP